MLIAFPIDAEQNRALSETKLQMPVLAIAADIYPALGGDLPGNITLNSTQALAANVTGITVPWTYIKFISVYRQKLLNNFFSGNSTTP